MPAADQLRNIFDFVSADNPAAAIRTVRRIRQAILSTARVPYTRRIGRVEGTCEITVSGTSYLVAYRIVERSIHVLANFHGAQRWPESF